MDWGIELDFPNTMIILCAFGNFFLLLTVLAVLKRIERKIDRLPTVTFGKDVSVASIRAYGGGGSGGQGASEVVIGDAGVSRGPGA